MHNKIKQRIPPRAYLALKIVGGLLVFLLALCLIAWLALPHVARWAIETQGSEALGRRMSVGEIHFNPFRLDLQLKDLKLAEADGQRDFVSLKQADVDVSSSSIWHLALVLDALRLDAPQVQVTRSTDGRFNFSDIVERFAAPPAEPDSEPFRFSVNNIEVVNGKVEFDDQPEDRIHHVDAIQLGIPFISNLPARADIHVQPLLDARVNGSRFQMKGEALLFAEQRAATLDLSFSDFNLADYLAYLPESLPVQLEKGRLNSGLHLVWLEAQADKPASLSLSGKLALNGFAAKERSGAPLLAFDALEADIGRIDPLAVPMLAEVSELRLKAPQIALARDREGVFNIVRLLAAPPSNPHPPQPATRKAVSTPPVAAASQTAPASAPAPARTAPVVAARPLAHASVPAVAASIPAASAPATSTSAKTPSPVVRVGRIVLEDGQIDWRDDTMKGGFATSLKPVSATLEGLDTSSDKPAHAVIKADAGKLGQLAADAQLLLNKNAYTGKLSLDAAALDALAPYYRDALGKLGLQGALSASSNFALDLQKPATQLQLDQIEVSLRELKLAQAGAKKPAVSVPEAKLSGGKLDLATHTVEIGAVSVRGVDSSIERDKEGRFTVPGLLDKPAASRPASAAAASSASSSAAAKKTAEPAVAWKVALKEASLKDAHVSLLDASGLAPVSVDFSGVEARLTGWNNTPGTLAGMALKSRVNKSGLIDVDGRLATDPFKADWRVNLKSVDIIGVQPYLDDLYRVLVNRGRLSANGRLLLDMSQPGTPDIRYGGTLAIDDFNAIDRLNETDFMRWKHFGIDRMRFQTKPLTVTTREVSVDDFFTRLILDEQGRLNVRELNAEDDAPAPVTAAGETAAAAAAAVAKVATEATQSGPGPVVNVERVLLSRGSVVYSDRFVKPNYEARLLDVNGSINGLSSDTSKLATLALKASMDGAAPVNVEGHFNPFRHDQDLDIQAQVRDVDLTSASTYAGRYVGYGIERGKLSMDVQYQIKNRQLVAKNRVKLDQLTFGERVDSPDATKLPVLFAVSLLKDRNGVIDVNLPVSGSLDDPQFSIGSVVLRVIRNLITRAVTAPFALLGSAFGGGDSEELAFIDFQPGSAQLGEKATQKLAELSKALLDRPALRLDVAGKADPAADAGGLKRARLDAAVRAVWAKKSGREDDASLQVPANEYPALLKTVYEDAKIDARPRNVIGILKDQPVAEMERLLLASYVVGAQDFEALANERAQNVRTWLLSQGKVASGRVFMLGGGGATQGADGKSAQARVEFSLNH